MTDEYFMKLALKLARKGLGHVSPNPMVGAVLVKEGKIIGAGYHRRFGGHHAEINAIRNARQDVAGSTLYVTLEPCCHEGKTPPCVESIIACKIARVVIGTIDANPLVSCQGVHCLRESGIEVKTGVLADECRKLNEVFFHYMETGMPFITIKYAQTLDGRIATRSGRSQWISSPASLKFAHRLRAQHDAILVGCKTVIKDNPELTVRLVRGRNPIRVIVDSHLKISPKAKVFQNTADAATILATTSGANRPRRMRLSALGVEIISVPADRQGHVDLKKLFERLAQRGISSILIEGGSEIITSALKQNLANRLVTVVSPKIIGKGIEAVGELNITALDSAKKISIAKAMRLGDDIIIDGRLS
ncbi:MAG TPA: bifunctional diaminohydroxyphosphoribosylaminopyrimidine deaminase/5-amino-6-(5-phosphoribosylamino)uracil reductase RibD [Smithella sp.]|nr:bifunctional diaminohydroxyphosphoribosylaminopyrimidine deaminase/5-amino-6-(5-phosphoribosylamino)uracil reductase RibD [Smithella sp.]